MMRTLLLSIALVAAHAVCASAAEIDHARTPVRADVTLADRTMLDVTLIEQFPSPCKQTDAAFMKGFKGVFATARLAAVEGSDVPNPFTLLRAAAEDEDAQRIEFSVGSDGSINHEIEPGETDSTTIANSYQNHVIVHVSTWLDTPLGMKAWTTKRHSLWMGMRTVDRCERMGRYAATLVLETLLHDSGRLKTESRLAMPGAGRDSVFSSKWD